MSAPGSIWLTRPRPDSERMAQSLQTRGIETIVAPVMEIRPLPLHIPSARDPKALLVTSRHATFALAALPARWRSLPVYCVGKATALAATKLGYNHCITGKGSALSLLPRIMAHQQGGDMILHLSGEEIRVPLGPMLAPYGITITRTIVYSAIATAALPDTLLDALDGQRVRGAVFYSPRSVTLAKQLLAHHQRPDALNHADAFCLSMAIAGQAAALHCQRLMACHTPTHHAMMELLTRPAIGEP